MAVFEKRTRIDAPAERVFAFHERPDALQLLLPPWEQARVLEKTPGLDVGARAVVEVRVAGVRRRIVAEHTAYEPGRMFRDEMRSGPFRKWVHTHTVVPDGPGAAWLVDHVEYELPLGAAGALAAGWFVRRKLERMFAFRHDVTRRACEGVAEGSRV